MRAERLLFPALRWDASTGFDHERDSIERALALGVGGFILFGGEAEEVRALTAELQRRSAEPLLIGADLERGAGQQFRGATPLPPLAALGALDDLEVSRRAGELTGREARALGVGWVYAPVADLDVEPRNPIVGTRAFGSDPSRVSEHVAAWVDGCRRAGALACAKHFPGHGRTVADSHVELPTVDVSRESLEADLGPFRAAAEAEVDSMMTAHVAYPALDPSGTPATLSGPIIGGLLREEIGFDGLVVTDALIMEGVLEGGRGEPAAAVAAVRAGCDALLYPNDPVAVAEAVRGAIGDGLTESRVAEAIRRIDAAAVRVVGPGATRKGRAGWGREEDLRWAEEIALRALQPVRGRPRLDARAVDLLTVDDDLGGPYPPGPREAFRETLIAEGVEVRGAEAEAEAEATEAHRRDNAHGAGEDKPLIVALYADIRAWKGRPGISERALETVARATVGRRAVVVLFGHPRLAAALAGEFPVLAAWGGEPLMQVAAGRFLSR